MRGGEHNNYLVGQRWQSGLRWAVVKLQHFLELRRRWLALAEDQAAAVGRLAQAVLQLETSRRAALPQRCCSILKPHPTMPDPLYQMTPATLFCFKSTT